MKKIVAIIAIVFVAFMVEAQVTPPKPTSGPVTTTDAKTVRNTNGPIGTATALLLSLGAGAVAYRVRKNRRRD